MEMESTWNGPRNGLNLVMYINIYFFLKIKIMERTSPNGTKRFFYLKGLPIPTPTELKQQNLYS